MKPKRISREYSFSKKDFIKKLGLPEAEKIDAIIINQSEIEVHTIEGSREEPKNKLGYAKKSKQY